ncbi:hypothetical protein ACFQ2B_30105 [Streptomyces stramineus]
MMDDRWNILDFARQAPNLTGGNAEFHTLPIAGFATRKGEAVNLVDRTKVRNLVQSMIGPGAPPAADSAKNGGRPGAGSAPRGRVAVPPAKAPDSAFQGPPVRMGGVPCVN